MTDAEMRDGETELEWAERTYHPCLYGIHVCGQGMARGNEVPVTVHNFLMTDTDQTRRIFDYAKTALHTPAKTALHTPDDPDDLIVDLMSAGGIVDNFHISRQLLPRLMEIVAEQNR